MRNPDIDELRSELEDYYGTAAAVMGSGNPVNFPPALGQMLEIGDLSDEEIMERAEELGLL